MTSDQLTSNMFLIFAQEDVEVLHDLFLTIGGSVNFLNVDFTRLQPLQDIGSKRFDPVFLPRIALLKKVKTVSIHGSVSQGFSPPTIAELYPSRQIFDTHLNAELFRLYNSWPWPFLQRRITGVSLAADTQSLALGAGSGGISLAVRQFLDPIRVYAYDTEPKA